MPPGPATPADPPRDRQRPEPASTRTPNELRRSPPDNRTPARQGLRSAAEAPRSSQERRNGRRAPPPGDRQRAYARRPTRAHGRRPTRRPTLRHPHHDRAPKTPTVPNGTVGVDDDRPSGPSRPTIWAITNASVGHHGRLRGPPRTPRSITSAPYDPSTTAHLTSGRRERPRVLQLPSDHIPRILRLISSRTIYALQLSDRHRQRLTLQLRPGLQQLHRRRRGDLRRLQPLQALHRSTQRQPTSKLMRPVHHRDRVDTLTILNTEQMVVPGSGTSSPGEPTGPVRHAPHRQTGLGTELLQRPAGAEIPVRPERAYQRFRSPGWRSQAGTDGSGSSAAATGRSVSRQQSVGCRVALSRVPDRPGEDTQRRAVPADCWG